MGVQLEYGRAELTLRRPWYAVAGGISAIAWLVAIIVASILQAIAAFPKPEAVAITAILGVVVLICVMTGVLVWRGVWRFSPNGAVIGALMLGLISLPAEALATSQLPSTISHIAGYLALAVILACVIALVFWGNQVMRYMDATLE